MKIKYKYYIVSFITCVIIYSFYSLTGYRKGYGFVDEPLSIWQSFKVLLENPIISILGFLLGTFLIGKVFEILFNGRDCSKTNNKESF